MNNPKSIAEKFIENHKMLSHYGKDFPSITEMEGLSEIKQQFATLETEINKTENLLRELDEKLKIVSITTSAAIIQDENCEKALGEQAPMSEVLTGLINRVELRNDQIQDILYRLRI